MNQIILYIQNVESDFFGLVFTHLKVNRQICLYFNVRRFDARKNLNIYPK